MAKKSVTKNYIYNVSYQILLIFVPIITTPYISRVLGVEGIGTYSYANSIVSYFLLVATLGTTTFGQREIAYYQNDIEARSRVFWELFTLRGITAAVSLIIYAVYLLNITQNRILFLILALNILNNIFDISWFFQGMEEFGKIVLRNLIIKIINILFIFIFIKRPEDLALYALGICVLTLAGSISLWSYLPKYILVVKKFNPFSNLRRVIEFFLPTIAFQIYSVLDKSMIGWASESSVDNGCYEQAEKIILMAKTVLTSMSTVLLPRMTNVLRNKQYDEARNYLYKACGFDFLIGLPLMFGLSSIASVFVPVFLGPGYEKAVILMIILSPIIVLTSLSGVIGYQYLIASGRQNTYTKVVIMGSIVNLGFNLIFIPKLLSVGASIGTIVSEIFNFTILVLYMKNNHVMNISKMFSYAVKPLIASLIMAMSIVAIKSALAPTWFSLIGIICVGALIYFVILFILRDKLLYDTLKSIINKIQTKTPKHTEKR